MGLALNRDFAKFDPMKQLMIVAIVALLAVACNNGGESEAPAVIKAEENPDAKPADATAKGPDRPIFREEEPEGGWPDGMPPTFAAVQNKHYKFMQKHANGLYYLEVRFFKDYLELKNSERQPFWNRFEIDLRGDTLFPHKKNEDTGELEGTGDFFIIHRVWGDDVNLTSYSEADPTQKTEIPFKRVTSIPDPMENSAPPLPTN